MYNIRAALPRGIPLSTLLERAYVFQTSDPRDKIYALLSLGPQWTRDAITIDYSLPLADIYRQVTLAMIKHEHTLCPFSRAGTSYQRLKDIPSWVTDWSSDLPHCQYSFETLGIPCRAAGDSKFDVQWPDDETLQTRSYKVATVSEVGQKVLEKQYYSSETITSSELVVVDATRVLCKRKCLYPAEKDTPDAFLRVWVGPQHPKALFWPSAPWKDLKKL